MNMTTPLVVWLIRPSVTSDWSIADLVTAEQAREKGWIVRKYYEESVQR